MGIPVIALAGMIGEEAAMVRDHGIDAFFTAIQAPCPLEEAMAGAQDQIERCADKVMMAFQVAATATARSNASSGGVAAAPAQ